MGSGCCRVAAWRARPELHRVLPRPRQEAAPLTQMCHPVEARVKAHLAHFVRARQEEVDHAVGDHAVWEAKELVVETTFMPKAVPKAWGARLHSQQLPVGGRETRDLPHRAPNLPGVRGCSNESQVPQS